MTNVSFQAETAHDLAALFQALSAPMRCSILLAIGNGEVCVCHLEALFHRRQAYLSQQLMALRKAKLLTDRREGRFIYYRLSDPRVLELIIAAAHLTGSGERIPQLVDLSPTTQCECPTCSPNLIQPESENQ